MEENEEPKSLLKEILPDSFDEKGEFILPKATTPPVEFAEAPVEPIEGATPIGAAAGAAYGLAHRLAPPFEKPSSAEFLRAQKRLREAEIGLNYVQSQHGAPADMVLQLQQELQAARAEMARAGERLRELPQPIRGGSASPTAAPTAADAAAAARKIPGASGAENYARVMAGQVLPDAISAQVEDMRKANPRGTSAYQVAEKDAQALAKIRSIGEGSQKLVGSGAGQLMLPEAEAARIEQEAARKAALAAAEQQRALQRIEQERAALTARLQQGSARAGDLQSQLREAQQAAGTVGRAQDKVSVAQMLLEEAEKAKVNPLARFGYAIARNPVIANTLAGAGTAMSAQDAINSYRQGDPLNAISSGIEAGFGGLSMLPFLPAKGIGAAGGLTTAGAKALAEYLGSRYGWGTSREAEEAFRRPSSSPPKRQ